MSTDISVLMPDTTVVNSPDSLQQSNVAELLAGIELQPDESLVPQIYRILWDQIVTLKIPPSQLISEKEIAESLNASKTPVREALIRLEDAGLVSIIPKSGTYVTPIRINTYIEGCFTRLRLETGAVQRAAERGHLSPHLATLDDILLHQAEALEQDEQERFFSLDQALHETFFLVAGIPGVWQFLRRTQADVNRLRHLKRINKILRGEQVIVEHKVIVAAIKERNAASAKAALITHIGSLESEIQQLAGNVELMTFIENQDTSMMQKKLQKKLQGKSTQRAKRLNGKVY